MCFQSGQEQSACKLLNYCHGKLNSQLYERNWRRCYSFYPPLLFRSFLFHTLNSHQHFLIPSLSGLSVSFPSWFFSPLFPVLLFIIIPCFYSSQLFPSFTQTFSWTLTAYGQEWEHWARPFRTWNIIHRQLGVLLVQNASAAMNEHKSSFSEADSSFLKNLFFWRK